MCKDNWRELVGEAVGSVNTSHGFYANYWAARFPAQTLAGFLRVEAVSLRGYDPGYNYEQMATALRLDAAKTLVTRAIKCPGKFQTIYRVPTGVIYLGQDEGYQIGRTFDAMTTIRDCDMAAASVLALRWLEAERKL